MNSGTMIKANPFIGVIAGVTAFSAVAFVMLSNSSQFVTVAQARKLKDANNLHLPGSLVKDSLKVDVNNAMIQFQLLDDNNEKIEVIHHGLPPANMADATRVVVVGGIKGDHFESNKLLTKCPSKYEEERKLPASSN
ncbi:MAG: cytochrome c maturation protein CcmE [Fimbriimonadaceae bacterium]